jgi:hypothetical protein
VVYFYTFVLVAYRLFLWFFPLQEGPVVGGQAAFVYCTYMLLNIFVFFPVLQSSFVLPFPFRRLFYLLLGARFGRTTHCSGVILDSPLIEFGDHVAIGLESIFSAHAAEGDTFVLARIRVGHRATIGARYHYAWGHHRRGSNGGGWRDSHQRQFYRSERSLGGVPTRRIKMLNQSPATFKQSVRTGCLLIDISVSQDL